MQFLYALEPQFHMSHLFKHLKICKTSHNQDFFSDLCTYHSQWPWWSGCYVSSCPVSILPGTAVCPGEKGSDNPAQGKRSLFLTLCPLGVEVAKLIFDPKNEWSRVCTPSRNRAAAQTHTICRQMFSEIALSEYDFFHATLKLLKWESCLPKKPSFKNERKGRGETSSPLLAFRRGHSLWEAEPGPGLPHWQNGAKGPLRSVQQGGILCSELQKC